MQHELNNFGIIVISAHEDYIFAKGCCASVKYFMPDVPLCLLVDGDFDLEGVPEAYDTRVIKREHIQNDFLKNNSFGWGKTRLISFWESPYEKFLIVDADTIIWGDVRELANFQDYDFLIDKPEYEYSINDLNKWFFDTDEIGKHFPTFDYMNNPYVCPAVLFGTKNIIPIKEYEIISDFIKSYPNIFKFGDMGFLNYLLFDLSKQKRIRLTSSDIQYIACDFDPDETRKRFRFENEEPLINGLSTVIHWPGEKKPLQKNPYGYYKYDEPMTFFRKQYLRDSTNLSEHEIERKILKEEKDRIKKIKRSRFKLRTFTLAKSIMRMFYSKGH